MIKQISTILIGLGIKNYIHTESQYDKRYSKIYIKHNIFISGKNRLEKWIKIIGFNNPKHLSKYLIWKKYGFCPPRNTLKDRIKILNNELDIHSFYK